MLLPYLQIEAQTCRKGHDVSLFGLSAKTLCPFRMVGDDEDEGALSDSEGNTVLPGDDLAKK